MKKILILFPLLTAQASLANPFSGINGPLRPGIGQPSFGIPSVGAPEPIAPLNSNYQETFTSRTEVKLNFGPHDLFALQYAAEVHDNPSLRPGDFRNPYLVMQEFYPEGLRGRQALQITAGSRGDHFHLPVYLLQPGQTIKTELDMRLSAFAGRRIPTANFELQHMEFVDPRSTLIEPLSGKDTNIEIPYESEDESGRFKAMGASGYLGVPYNLNFEYTNQTDKAIPVRLHGYLEPGMRLEVFSAQVALSYGPGSLVPPSNTTQLQPDPMIPGRLPEQPFRLSFHYDLNDLEASQERVCKKVINNVAQPGVGLDKLLHSECSVFDRELTNLEPVYQLNPNRPDSRIDRFDADFDVYYNFPCIGGDISLGLTARPGQPAVLLSQQRLNRRLDYQSFYQGDRTPLVALVQGNGRLRLRNLSEENQLATIARCGLHIHRAEMYPSVSTLANWINLAEIQVDRIENAIDAYRLAASLARQETIDSTSLNITIRNLERLRTEVDTRINQAIANGNTARLNEDRQLLFRLDGILNSLRNVVNGNSDGLAQIGGSEDAEMIAEIFRQRLIDRGLEAQAMLRRFDYFREATNVERRRQVLNGVGFASLREVMGGSNFDQGLSLIDVLQRQGNEIAEVNRSINAVLSIASADAGLDLGNMDLAEMSDDEMSFDMDMSDSNENIDEGMSSGQLKAVGFLAELGEFETDRSHTMDSSWDTFIRERSIGLTMTCSWATRPYVYQLQDVVLFVDRTRTSVNVFDHDRVRNQGCDILDLSDHLAVQDYKNRFANLADVAPDINLAARNHSMDNSIWELIAKHSRRIVQNCPFAQRPNIYQFRDAVIYVTQDRRLYNVYRNEDIPSNCELPNF